MKNISVTVITQNEENNIKDCLASVCWADEIVVVDSNSTDKTVEICKEFTDKIFIRKWEGFAAQKQFAIDQCQYEWILSIDADERVLPACRDEIIETIKRNDVADGYLIARQSYFLNKWIKYSGWYPGYQLRFFKRSKTHVSQALVHEGFIVDGRIGTLENDLVHYSHPSLFISLEKLNRYSTLEALDRMERKKVYWYDFIIHPFGTFVKKYFIQKGFLDGLHGFLLTLISTFLKMVLYMKLWKLQKMSPDEIGNLKKGDLLSTTISVILITLNEEKNIKDCLQSVQWADEIVVIDSFSTDRTAEMAQQYTDIVIQTEWKGYSFNKNLALQHATSDWILWIDADERVTPELEMEIKNIVANQSGENGFEIPRKAFFLGRWIKHCGWYPGYVLRLFRRGKGRFNDNQVHEGLELDGKRGKLVNALLHYTDDSLDHYLWKFNRYTSLAANDLAAKERQAGLASILFRPLFTFIKMYFLKRGFLDGVEGFMLCLLSSFYVSMKYAKLWEKRLTDIA